MATPKAKTTEDATAKTNSWPMAKAAGERMLRYINAGLTNKAGVLPIMSGGKLTRQGKDIHTVLVGMFDAPIDKAANKVTPDQIVKAVSAMALATDGAVIPDPDLIQRGTIALTTPTHAESAAIDGAVSRAKAKDARSVAVATTRAAFTDAVDVLGAAFKAGGFDPTAVKAKARAAALDATMG